MLDDRSSGGSFEMCEDVTLTVRERTTECCGVTSKVGFDRVIGLLFKWLPRTLIKSVVPQEARRCSSS
jgi:hypothetical protein